MKREMFEGIVTSAKVMGLVLLASTQAWGGSLGGSAPEEVKTKLTETFKNFEVEEVNGAPIEGLYEVIAQPRNRGGDKNILYYDPSGNHLVFGEIYSSEGKNLTAETKDRLMKKKIENIDLTSALKFGDGENIVIEVTDPDCPYCRKGAKFMDEQENVTRYVFFAPLPMHKNAPEKAAYILSSDDPEKAMNEVFGGKYDREPVPEFKDNNKLKTHKMIVAELGIRGTPAYWINGNFVNGANIEAIKHYLSKQAKD